MKVRRRISGPVIADILTASRRRCCLCFVLRHDASEKRGQIAHLDQDRTNGNPDNLAFLCLEHHDQYDGTTSQSKGLTLQEVKRYRAQLVAALAHGAGLPRLQTESLSAVDHSSCVLNSKVESVAVYENAVAATVDHFLLFDARHAALEPLNLPRYFDSSALDLLGWASKCIGVLEKRRRTAKRLPVLSQEELNAFTFHCFVALMRGYLLDRFAETHDLTPDVLPHLPKREIVEQRWYEDVVVEDKWLHEWSQAFSRDLIDAWWLVIEEKGEAQTCPIPCAIYKSAMLQGVVARRFLMRGAKSLAA
jgi:hypothetical protein